MAFTGNEDHDIPLATAAEWTANYRSANPGATKGHYFGKDEIDAVLNQQDCVGIRIYYALNDSGSKELVIVGVKANEDDMDGGLILDRSIKCPPTCGSSNSLNS